MRIAAFTVPILLLLAGAGCTKLKSSFQSIPQATASSPSQAKASAGSVKPPTDPTAKEREKFVGTWQAVDGEFQGVRMTPASLKEIVWTFSADKVSFSMLGRAMEASYSLQPNANPKTFDFKGPETAIQGIYEWKGDTLRVCCAATERPSAFGTGGTSQDTLMFVFQKSKRTVND